MMLAFIECLVSLTYRTHIYILHTIHFITYSHIDIELFAGAYLVNILDKLNSITVITIHFKYGDCFH